MLFPGLHGLWSHCISPAGLAGFYSPEDPSILPHFCVKPGHLSHNSPLYYFKSNHSSVFSVAHLPTLSLVATSELKYLWEWESEAFLGSHMLN